MAGSPVGKRGAHPMTAPGHEIEVLEKNTDTTGAAFQALQNQHDAGFQKTEPAVLPATGAPAGPAELTVDDVVQEARRHNRVCPKPAVWQRLHDWLPNKPAQLAAVPTSGEWALIPALQMRSRLREHIEWAAAQGLLHKVHQALAAMPEERWHHIGE